MEQDKGLLVIITLTGIVATISILGGLYDLLTERRKNVSNFHVGVSMLLFGVPSLTTVFLYVLCRLNYLKELLTEDGYGFLCFSFFAIALLAPDVYVLTNQKNIENQTIISIAKNGLFFSVICFIGVIIFWVRTADKSTLFLFLK